jgi:hypothetical protein
MLPYYQTILNYAKDIASYAENGLDLLKDYLPESMTSNYSPLTLAFFGIFGSVVALKIGYKLFRWLRGNIAYIYDYIQGGLVDLQYIRTNWHNTKSTN